MKYCFHALAGAALALAQSNTTLYRTDLSGHRVPEEQYRSSDGDRSDVRQNLNGNKTALRTTETHVLSDQPNHRVTETIVRTYDSGVLASTTKTVTDEQSRPGGSTLRATIYRNDGNGRLVEDERRVVEAQIQGATTTAAVTVSRSDFTGSFQTTEKHQVVTTTEGNTTRETEAIQLLSRGSGQLYDAARYVREETKSSSGTTASTTRYEPDELGKMSLIRQETANTVKNGDGTQVTERSLYAPNVPGIARVPQTGMKLYEQQSIVRREGGGTVTETTSVRHPTQADQRVLGDSRVISNLVCTGKCDGPLQ